MSYQKVIGLMDWLITLKGDTHDLDHLTRLKLPECSIERREGKYFLKSNMLNTITDHRKVRSYILDTLQAINGAIKLQFGLTQPVELEGIALPNENGTTNQFAFARLPVVILLRGKEDFTRKMDFLSDIISISFKDKKVKEALSYFQKSDTPWFNFYKILEVIQSDVGGLIQKNGWATKREIDNFTQTANSHDALGEQSRHASNMVKAPKNPMSLKQAESLIKRILGKWIEYKS